MKEISNLSIKELIESIEENILETSGLRKRLLIETNHEKDANVKKYKNELIAKYNEDISRYRMQKLELEEIIREHAVYGYKKLDSKVNEKTAQEEQVQEQSIKNFKPCSSDGKVYDDSESISNPLIGLY